MSFIRIGELSKSYGRTIALDALSLEIGKGEFVTLLGPSGCGKTTTLRLLAGFLEPDRGTIHVADRELSSAARTTPPEERRMGMVFQNYAVWPHMTVRDNVGFGLKLARTPPAEAHARVDRMLSALGLAGLEARMPAALSGGQQQRVALARSLVTEPDILLLDEPLSNLDAKLRERMREELKALQRKTGITFVYVTHDQAEAMALSDRIAVFSAGRLQQYAGPREVYERPANLFVADFMGLLNRVDCEIIGRTGERVGIRLAGQPLTGVAGSSALPATGPAILAIRPEAIMLREGSTASRENVLTGTVVGSTFLGNMIDYRIDIGGGIVLRVQGNRFERYEVGRQLPVEIALDDLIVMAPE